MNTKDLMEWSRSIINSIMSKQPDYTYIYTMNIILKPNPLDFDGIDVADIKIIRVNQRSKHEDNWFRTARCINLDDAIEMVNKAVAVYLEEKDKFEKEKNNDKR